MRLCALMIGLCVLAAPGWATSLEGVVKDPSGAVVAGAPVSIERRSGGPRQTFRTDSAGHFNIDGLPPGRYVLSVDVDGFETDERAIELADQPLTLTISLKIKAQTSNIEIVAKRPGTQNADPNYLALRNGEPVGSCQVSNLELKRDAGALTFRSGYFSFLPAVLGRVSIAVFVGEGDFHLTPAIFLERQHIEKLTGKSEILESFRSATLVFTDATYEYLKEHCQSVDEPSRAGDALRQLRNRLRKRDPQYGQTQNLEAELLAELYNPNERGSFSAYLHGPKHADLRFFAKPRGAVPEILSPEEVAVVNVDPGGPQDGIWYLTHFMSEWQARTASSDENHRVIAAGHYRVETVLGKDDHLTAICELKFRASLDGVRVLHFGLLPALRVTSVSFGGDRATPFIQESRKQDGEFTPLSRSRW